MQRFWMLAWILFGLVAVDFPAGAADAMETPNHAARSIAEASPVPGTLFLYPEAIALEDGGFVVAERGMLHVPLVRSDPKSSMIGIEIYRFKASGEAAKRPPVFKLNGGPGFPGLTGAFDRPGFYESRIMPHLKVADLVVVGQRGIGSSKPDTICGSLPPRPLDQDATDDELAEILRGVLTECKTFWDAQGMDLRGLNVIEAAADVKDARTALGYDKIVIEGGSFGSHWGMTVMRYHPDIVARAVLHGMEGPDHTYDMPGWVLNALKRFAAEAEASPELQDRIPDGGLVAAFQAVAERLDLEPVLVEVESPDEDAAEGETVQVRIDGDNIRDLALGYSRRASSRRGISTWAADVLHLYEGDYSGAAEVMARRGSNPRNMPTASFFMLDCGSGITPARLEQLNKDPAQRIVGETGWFYQSACPVWGSDLGDAFRQNFTSEIPTVIVHGNWDTSTPYENALELAPYFKNSKMVTVKGGSHSALTEARENSAGFHEALETFLKTGDLSGLPEEVDLPDLEWEVPELDDNKTVEDKTDESEA